MGSGASKSKAGTRAYEKAEEPKEKRRRPSKLFHNTEKHGPKDFVLANKILEAYPETLNQQRVMNHQEREVSDAQFHKMKWKHTYSKAPMKLVCNECSETILRLQDELPFHFCASCWRRSDNTFRYELCTKCFTKLERKGSVEEKENAVGNAGNLRRPSKRVSFQDDEIRLLKLGGEVMDEAPGLCAPALYARPVPAQYSIDEGAPGFGYDCSAYDQHAAAQARRSAANGAAYRPVYAEPPLPTVQHSGIHPAAQAFVPPPEPSMAHNGVHPAARAAAAHPSAAGQPVDAVLRRSRSENREERRAERHAERRDMQRARSTRV